MSIPVTYNLRNLAVRRTTTVMTALGIALPVAVLLAALALVNGLRTALESTGEPLNVLVLRKGSASELPSGISRAVFRDMLFKPGIAVSGKGQPMASLEIVTTVRLAGKDLTVRGLLPIGIELRDITLESGRWFRSGHREIVVGKSVATRYPASRLRFGKSEWEVVGVLDGGRSTANSEIFGDLNQVSSDFNRPDGLSSVLIRAKDEVAVPALVNSLNEDPRLNVIAQPERAYYDRQTNSAASLQAVGIFVAIIMAVGSSFAAMNTMYATVARRSAEIATLRVLGFSRASILASFLIESLLLAGLGGVIGCLLVLPLNYVSTGIGNFNTMSEVMFHFHVEPLTLAGGIVFSLVIGATGGLLPAALAANREILTALDL
jgi:putative ABC transport system permease protein